MQNAGRAFRFLTGNLKTSHQFLVFQTHSERTKKRIKVRYAGFFNLQSIFKDTTDMN